MKPIISPNIRFRYNYQVGDYSIIDDFCYFSVNLQIGKFFHIAPHCLIAGGKDRKFTCGDFGALASGVKIYCASDDFRNDIGNILPADCTGIKDHVIKGDVILQNFVTIGANSVVMPKNLIPVGTVIGALSFVPTNFQFDSWSIYVGNPIRKIGNRNISNVLREVNEVRKKYNL